MVDGIWQFIFLLDNIHVFISLGFQLFWQNAGILFGGKCAYIFANENDTQFKYKYNYYSVSLADSVITTYKIKMYHLS